MKKYRVEPEPEEEDRLAPLGEATASEEAEKPKEKKKKKGKCAKCCSKVAYKFDNWISQRASQTYALTAFLFIAVLAGGCLLYAADTDNDERNFPDAIWTSWTFMADPGTHSDTAGWGMRFVALLTTMVGVVIFSVIMGLVIEAVFAKMESLKKGKSVVVEEDHTLMLGWNDECFGFIEEICLANESEGGGVIVVLSPGHDKEEMEKQLYDRFSKAELMGTKVVFRTGSPMQAADLEKVAAPEARSTVIFNEYWAAREPDATILRVILALKGLSDDFAGHIVAEVHSEDNVPLIEMAGDGCVETIVSHAFVGRLMLMAARQPGLATVYHETLGFDGDEFYVKEWPECYGLTFAELMPRFKQAVLMGIKAADGEIKLRPPNDYVYSEGEEIVVIAEDDDTYEAEDPVEIDRGESPPEYVKADKPEFILLCGWRRGMCSFLDLLNDMVSPGTKCHMICDTPFEDRKETEDEARYKEVAGSDGVSWIYENMQLWHYVGNTTSRKLMGALPLHQYTSVMILASQSREEETMRSDSQCVATLLLVHDLRQAKLEDPNYKPVAGERDDRATLLRAASKANLGKKASNKQTGLAQICELLDPRTQQTISDNKLIQGVGCDFVRSNTMISQVLAMVAEDPGNRLILKELLGPNGASMNIESSKKYASPGEVCSFWTIAQRVVDKGHILLGYQSNDGSNTVMNPHDKDAEISWDDNDCVVLINPDNAAPASASALPSIHSVEKSGGRG
mmetsp:Transcript_45590/g.89705  ORF Transcript_45590/g.89705 Transcript_45590/m.89705 type:complete len:739 (+) Transcript_45590:132-2348(+)